MLKMLPGREWGRTFLGAVLMVAALASGCGGDDPTPPTPTLDPCGGCSAGLICNAAVGECQPLNGNNTPNPNNNAPENNNPNNNAPEACEGGCAAPAAFCEENVLVTYTGEGTCNEDEDTCEFADVEERTDCPVRCLEGACLGETAGDKCEGNEDCGDGLFCDEGGLCAEGCADDESCEDGFVCSEDTRECVINCMPDAYEPNDETPTTGAYNLGQVIRLEDANVCGEDLDLFALQLEEGYQLRAALEVMGNAADLDFRILNSNGDELAAGSGADELMITVETAGLYTAEISRKDPEGSTDYNVSVFVQEGETPCFDLREPNDSGEEATDLTESLEYNEDFNLTNLRLCSGDVDFFRISANPQDTLTLSFGGVPSDGIEVRVLADDDNELVLDQTIRSDEQISRALPDGGEYLVIVAPARTVPEEGVPYNMGLRLEEAVVACEDDAFEENNSFATAARLGSGQTPNLVFCAEDVVDFYTVPASAGAEVSVEVIYDDLTDGALSVVVYDADENPVSFGERADCAGSPCEKVEGLNSSSQSFYFVEVRSSAVDPRAGYRVNVITDGCPPDRYEPNDDWRTAPLLNMSCRTESYMCPFDTDYYRVEVGPEEVFHMGMRHFRTRGDLDFALYREVDGELEPVDISRTGADCEPVNNTLAPNEGTYYLRVISLGGEENDYSIVPTDECGIDEPQFPACF